MNLAIFDAEKAPVRGLRTRWAAYATGLGFWSLLSNVRWGEDGSIRVRFGSELKTSGTIGGASDFKGFWAGTVNGTWMALAAVRAGGVTTIYKSTNMSTWTATTTAAGYESAGFSTDGWVYFDVIKHPEISESTNSTGAEFKDIVVAQNGSDYPRVSDSTVANFYVHRPIPAPTKAGLRPAVFGVDGVASLQDSAATVFTATGAGITLAATGTVPNQYYRLAITSGVTNGSTAKADFTGNSTSLSNIGPILMLGVETTYTQWIDKVKIEISDDNTNWNLVHDPDTDEYYNLYAAGSNRIYYQFNVRQNADTAASSTAYVRITWVASTAEAPGSTQNVDIFFLATVGGSNYDARGDDLFATCNYNPKTFVMSPGVVINSSTVGVRLVENGGADLSGTRLPIVANFQYKAYVPYQITTTTERDRGVECSMIFRKQAEDIDYRLVFIEKWASYSGGWTFDGSAPANGVYRTHVQYDLQPRLPFPTAFHIPIPKGTAMEKANNHFFVGAAIGSGVAPGAYFSRLDFDTHFMEIPDLNLEDYSPGSAIMAGESVQAITAVNTNIYQNSLVYVHTNRNLYAFAGTGLTDLSKIGRVANSGTLSPRSVVVHKSALYWLDHEAQFRRLKTGYEVENLSRLAVDDKLKEIPASRRDDVVCAAHGDRIYIGYTPTGDTKNVSILVFNTVTDEWESIDDLPSSINAEAFVVKDDSNVPKLYFAGQNCHVYEHEVDGRTQDLTTGSVAVDMRTGNLHDFMETPNGAFVFRNVQMVLDRGQTGAITVTRTYQPGGGTLAGTLTATSGSGIGWVEDVLGTATGVARGKACQLKFTGGLKGGSRIYAISVEVEDRDSNSTSS